MHRDHDTFSPHGPRPVSAGHNHRAAAQWQTPHRPDALPPEVAETPEPDFDLVEAAFADAFPRADDPTSFLRLAGVPFSAVRANGTALHLLRVEVNETADVGALMPGVGGSFRYAPLPRVLASRRRDLAFVYTDGAASVRLSLAEAKALAPVTEAQERASS